MNYPEKLIEKLELKYPLIGLYDAPGPEGFEPVIQPESGKLSCLYSFLEEWVSGKMLMLSRENSGCGGCAYWLFGKENMTREHRIKFLVGTEGLKDTEELMDRWLNHERPYKPEHNNIFLGPLRPEMAQYLKTITFLINPDQLTILTVASQYYHSPDDLFSPVIAPMGSGCMQLLPLFKDLYYPQAIIGATDIAMRKCLPPDILSFTVTEPLFRQFCLLDERSFLYKSFLDHMKKSRA